MARLPWLCTGEVVLSVKFLTAVARYLARSHLRGGRVRFWLTPRGETVHCDGRRVRELSTLYLQSGSNEKSRARSRHLKAGLPVTYFLR